MIRSIARCPYCRECEIAIDDDPPAVIFDPDRPRGLPCPHLASISVQLIVTTKSGLKRQVKRRSREWFWIREKDLRKKPVRCKLFDPLESYIRNITWGFLPGKFLPDLEHEVVGARNLASSGTFKYALWVSAGTQYEASLSGGAIYALAPARFAKLARDLAFRVDISS